MILSLRREGIARLSEFVRDLAQAGALTQEAYRRWRKDPRNAKRMAEYFDYTNLEGVPSITALVGLDFHPRLPLLMFNYSPLAHNTLHASPHGWTPALRMCRGIVFNHAGILVAHPYPKFFNLNEHPETELGVLLARCNNSYPWSATDKLDGHCGIIFSYQDELIVTTRGRFTSPSAQLATEILYAHEQNGWKKSFLSDWTLIVEIIDPKTKVHVEYGDQSGFVLTGAFHRVTFEDASPALVDQLSNQLRIPAAKRFLPSVVHQSIGDALRDLVKSMKDRSVRNKEGWVIRFEDGTRVKVKYETYIQLMVVSKLSPSYLMRRMMSGNLDRMLGTLDEEIVSHANELLGRIVRVLFMNVSVKEQRQYLYGLVPPEESTSYYRSVCREFLNSLTVFHS